MKVSELSKKFSDNWDENLEKNKHLIHVYPPFKDDSAYSEGDDATILSTEEWE